MDTISFTRMADGTAEEYAFLDRVLEGYLAEARARLPQAMIKLLGEQRGNALGYRVDRYTHSLQAATRAFRDGADEGRTGLPRRCCTTSATCIGVFNQQRRCGSAAEAFPQRAQSLDGAASRAVSGLFLFPSRRT